MSSSSSNVFSGTPSSATDPIVIVGYVSDVEGNYDYWCRYVQMSRILSRDTEGKIELKDGSHIVYGGDVVDRGPGDIRVLSDLIDLKKTYPDRVHFILGNRDINKMRIPVELTSGSLCSPAKVYWVKESGGEEETPGDRLKWMLSKTMGSPMAFEYRRDELKLLGCDTTDDAVAASYLELMKPEGLLTKYLEYGKIAVILGDTLFIHGAIHPYNLGWLPPSRKKMHQTKDGSLKVQSPEDLAGHKFEGSLREWVDLINQFAYEEARDFTDHLASYIAKYEDSCATDGCPVWPISWASIGGYNHPQPGSRLLQYGMGWLPDKTLNPSTVYSNYLMAQGSNGDSMLEPSVEVAAYLKMSGIRKVIVGHQPRGDAPLILDLNAGIQIISADTSYAANTLWDTGNTGDWTSLPHRPSNPATRSSSSPIMDPPTRGTGVVGGGSAQSALSAPSSKALLEAAGAALTYRGPSASYRDLMSAAVMHHNSSGGSESKFSSPHASITHIDNLALGTLTLGPGIAAPAPTSASLVSFRQVVNAAVRMHSKDDSDPSVQKKNKAFPHWPSDIVKRVAQLSNSRSISPKPPGLGGNTIFLSAPPTPLSSSPSTTTSKSISSTMFTLAQSPSVPGTRRSSAASQLASQHLISDVTSSQSHQKVPSSAWKLGVPQKENSRGIAVAEIILLIPEGKLHMVGAGANFADTELLSEWRMKNISVPPHNMIDPRSRSSLSVCASSDALSTRRLSVGSDSSLTGEVAALGKDTTGGVKLGAESYTTGGVVGGGGGALRSAPSVGSLVPESVCSEAAAAAGSSSSSVVESNSSSLLGTPESTSRRRKSDASDISIGAVVAEDVTSPLFQMITDTFSSFFGGSINLSSATYDDFGSDNSSFTRSSRPQPRRTVTPPPERGHVPSSAFQSIAADTATHEDFNKGADDGPASGRAMSPVLRSFSRQDSMDAVAAPEPVSKLYITGVLSEGTEYSFQLPPSEDNQYIGKRTSDGWYVKATGIRPYNNVSIFDDFGDIDHVESDEDDDGDDASDDDDENGTQVTEVHTHTPSHRNILRSSTVSAVTDDLEDHFPSSPKDSGYHTEFRPDTIKSMLEDSDSEDNLNNGDDGHDQVYLGALRHRLNKQRSNSSDCTLVLHHPSPLPRVGIAGMRSISLPVSVLTSSCGSPVCSPKSPSTGSRSTNHTTTATGADTAEDTATDSLPSSERTSRGEEEREEGEDKYRHDHGEDNNNSKKKNTCSAASSSEIKKSRSRDKDKEQEQQRDEDKDKDKKHGKDSEVSPSRRGRRPVPSLYLLAHASGFTVKNKIVTEAELRKLLNLDPPPSAATATLQVSRSSLSLESLLKKDDTIMPSNI